MPEVVSVRAYKRTQHHNFGMRLLLCVYVARDGRMFSMYDMQPWTPTVDYVLDSEMTVREYEGLRRELDEAAGIIEPERAN